MITCPHNEWLKLHRDRDEWSITYEGRLQKLVADMTHADTQYPSLLLFIGKKNKKQALRALFPAINHKRRSVQGIISLNIDPTTADAENPMLFAEANPENLPIKLNETADCCHETKRYRLDWVSDQYPKPETGDVVDRIYSLLLLPFTDVLCLFAEDFLSLEEVSNLLCRWAERGQESAISRPRVIIIVTQTVNSADFIKSLPDVSKSFSSVTIIALLDAVEVSPTARYFPLKDALLREADYARRAKITEQALFSATHLRAFFHKALIHFTTTTSLPFSFFRASREGSDIDDQFSAHLGSFLQLCYQHEVSLDDAATYIASAILVDSSPPGMHRKILRPPIPTGH